MSRCVSSGVGTVGEDTMTNILSICYPGELWMQLNSKKTCSLMNSMRSCNVPLKNSQWSNRLIGKTWNKD